MAAVLSAPLTTSAPALTICRAKRILQQHESELHGLAQALLDRETLSGEQIVEMLRKQALAKQ
jgi:ATP-dependent Zn protease